MESMQQSEIKATTTLAIPTTCTPTSRLAAAVRAEKPILELPKLVPVTDPKPSMESQQQQQSVLKKSVTTSPPTAAGLQNSIKIVPRTIPIKTIKGPNGNLIVHGPHNRIVSLHIKGSKQTTPQPAPLSLVPIHLRNETKSAMLKLSGLTSIQARKIAPKETTNLASPKSNPYKDLMPGKEITMTTKPATSLAKTTTQESQSLFKASSKESPPGLILSPSVTTVLSTATSQVISTLVSSKALEIKPITVSDSPKALTPAQAATVPMTQITATNLLPKLSTMKADTHELDSVTIEKKATPKLQPSKKELGKETLIDDASTVLAPKNNKMISLQISNGKLSDPNGPIKLISANNNAPRVRQEKPPEKVEVEPVASVKKDLGDCTDMSQPLTPPPCSIATDLDREAASSELQQQNKQVKNKQQSLLRNKTVDMLQRSPRLQHRSKSLTALQTKLGRRRRKLSAASDSDLKRAFVGKRLRIPRPMNKTPPEVQVNKLLCPEKISTSSDSLGSLSSSAEEKMVPVVPAYAPIEIIDMNSSDDEYKPSKEDRASSSPKVNENEFYSCLNWQDGVGSLKESSLQFQFNEFGLIEILESNRIKTELDLHYEKPIFEREFKSQKTLDYSNPYYCKGCNCKGAAVDFLTPEFCSRECIRRYNGRIKSYGGMKATKKYGNRKKYSILLDDISEDGLEIKSDYERLIKSPSAFSWDTYLSSCKGEPTPIDLFLNPFPCSSNMFQIGMKLEAIDPENSSLFCVCTIVEKIGYRLKLHFDGYGNFYDFWVNADSMDIFPPGWCAKTNRALQPPRGISPMTFNWPNYLNHTKATPAPRNLFTHLNSSSRRHRFTPGMKIEADDLRNSGKVCVATIADILDNRLLIVFDGWDDSYSYWIDINSPYIHPVNWHKKNGFSIVPPPECENRFSWAVYLAFTESEAATEDMFRTRDPIDFKVGMKLEVVDKHNPSLIRPASIIMTNEYEIKVLFEGWPMDYAFWVEDDSPDIHPIGWCEITNHDLDPPPGYTCLQSRYGCKFPACRGIGNAINPEMDIHDNITECPYEPENWTKEVDKSGRLSSYRHDARASQDLKRKQIIPRNKRKAEPPRVPMATKLPRYPIQPLPKIIQPPAQPPVQITPNTGISLLASKHEEKKPETGVDPRVNIARHLLCDYGPRLQQVYSLWKQNSECLTVNLAEHKDHSKNPLEWNVNEVAEYIAKLPRCQTISQEFLKQEIDGAAFLSMRQSDLTEILKVKLGPAIKIYNQIVQLREDVVTQFTTDTPKVS